MFICYAYQWTDTPMGRRLQTTDTSLAIVDLLKELDGATMPTIADRLDLAESTVHGHLKTLEANRLVVKEGNEYHLGLQFLSYGNSARTRKPEYQFAQEHVDRLAGATSEGANFCVEEHGQIIGLNAASAADDPVYFVGRSSDMHNTAVGKAILAEMSDEAVREVVDRWGLSAYTDNTITDEAALFEALERVRETGVSFNREELLDGLSSAAMVVKRPDSSVLGALSVGGPTYRIGGEKLEEEFPDLLRERKRAFEQQIRSVYSRD